PLRFPDSIPSARYQRWHRDVNGGLAPDDGAGNRNLLFRPTLLSPRYYIDGNEGIIESLLPRDAMPYFTASISIVGVTLLLMPEMDSEALLNINPKSLRVIGSVVTMQRVRSGRESLLRGVANFTCNVIGLVRSWMVTSRRMSPLCSRVCS